MRVREALARAQDTLDMAYTGDPELVGCNLDYNALQTVVDYLSVMIPVDVPEPEGDFSGWQDVIDAGEAARKAMQEKMNHAD